MRIAVRIRRLVQQPPALGQTRDDDRAGRVHLHAGDQLGHPACEAPVRADRIVDRQAIALADREILLAVRRRGVHGTGAGLERHVIAEDHWHVLREPRMLELQPLEQLAPLKRTSCCPSRP